MSFLISFSLSTISLFLYPPCSFFLHFLTAPILPVDLNKSVGIATRYRLDVPKIESQWGRAIYIYVYVQLLNQFESYHRT